MDDSESDTILPNPDVAQDVAEAEWDDPDLDDDERADEAEEKRAPD